MQKHTDKPGYSGHSAPHVPTQKELAGATTRRHVYVVPACSLQSIDLKCEHTGNRRAARDQTGKLIIEVIPSGKTITTSKLAGTLEVAAFNGGDTVTLTAHVRSPDSRHPLWTISGPGISDPAEVCKTPVDYEFMPPQFSSSITNIIGFYWCPNLDPNEYTVKCVACKGGTHEALVRVWPHFKSDLSICTVSAEDSALTASKDEIVQKSTQLRFPSKNPSNEWTSHLVDARKIVSTVFDFLSEWIPNVKEVKCTLLEGSLTLSNQWKEADGWRVEWEGSLELKMVVISLEVKIALAQANFLPKSAQAVFDRFGADFEADVYFTIAGEIDASITGKWSKEGGVKPEGEVSGEISLGLGVEAEVNALHNLISADFSATTKLAVKCKPQLSDGPCLILEPSFEWGELVLAGVIKFQRKNVPIIGEIDNDIYNKQLTLFEAHEMKLSPLQLWPIDL